MCTAFRSSESFSFSSSTGKGVRVLFMIAENGFSCYNKGIFMKYIRSLLAAFEDLWVPLAIFGAVFLCGMVTLSVLFSPGRFPVRLGDRMVRFRDLSAEEQLLVGRQQELLKERARVLSLTPAPMLAELSQTRSDVSASFAAITAIEAARRELATSGIDHVLIETMSFDEAARSIRIAGVASDSDGSSVQILALFVDKLRASPLFSFVREPEYREVRDGNGAVTSPFVITLTISNES